MEQYHVQLATPDFSPRLSSSQTLLLPDLQHRPSRGYRPSPVDGYHVCSTSGILNTRMFCKYGSNPESTRVVASQKVYPFARTKSGVAGPHDIDHRWSQRATQPNGGRSSASPLNSMACSVFSHRSRISGKCIFRNACFPKVSSRGAPASAKSRTLSGLRSPLNRAVNLRRPMRIIFCFQRLHAMSIMSFFSFNGHSFLFFSTSPFFLLFSLDGDGPGWILTIF